MRFVVDANQSLEVQKDRQLTAAQKKKTIIVLPPLIWAQIVLSPKPGKILSALTEFDLKFGMDYGDIRHHLSHRTEDGIQDFEPLWPQESCEHAIFSDAMRRFARDGFLRQKARQMKEKWCAYALKQRKRLADAQRNRKSVCKTIDEAVEKMGTGADSLMALTVIDFLSDKGKLHFTLDDDSLYEAVVHNPFLRRFLHTVFGLRMGYCKLWKNTKFNTEIRPKSNDWADESLPLYAADGDVIVTADKAFRRLFRHIDPEEKVALKTWDECVQMIKVRGE